MIVLQKGLAWTTVLVWGLSLAEKFLKQKKESKQRG